VCERKEEEGGDGWLLHSLLTKRCIIHDLYNRIDVNESFS
jgi:hypothetical protein